jgi:hypothetical protein
MDGVFTGVFVVNKDKPELGSPVFHGKLAGNCFRLQLETTSLFPESV